MDTRLKGEAALKRMESRGQTWASPAETAHVVQRDVRTVYGALKRGEIPSTKVGQRYYVSVAWLRRQVDGVAA